MRISNGKMYLIEERVPLRTHQLLRTELARGRIALYISKHSPSQLGTQFDLGDDPLETKWLTPRPEDSCIPPMNLERFEHDVKEFIQNNQNGIIILNGLDVLEMWNGFKPVLNVLKRLQAELKEGECNFVISLDPKSHYQTSLMALEKVSDEVVYPTV